MTLERPSLLRTLTIVGLYGLALGTFGALLVAFFILARDFLPPLASLVKSPLTLVFFSATYLALVTVATFLPFASLDGIARLTLGVLVCLTPVGLTTLFQERADLSLQPRPLAGADHRVIGGSLFFDEGGSGVFRAEFPPRLVPLDQVVYDPMSRRFLHARAADPDPRDLRWIGEAQPIEEPPLFLLELFRDFHELGSIAELLTSQPRDLANPVMFFLGLFSWAMGILAVASFQLPRLLSAIGGLVAGRLAILLHRFAWREAPHLVTSFWQDWDPLNTWWTTGWMPLALGLGLFFLLSYKRSVDSSRTGGDERT